MMTRSLASRWTATALAVIFCTTALLGPLAEHAFAMDVPEENPAGGTGAGAPMMVTGSLVDAANGAYKNVINQITRTMVVALFNAVQSFLGQMAYDAANYIASGGKGQDAQFFKKGFAGYLGDVASDAMGEFIGSLSTDDFFKKLGYNLCQPTDPRALLKIQLSLSDFFPGLQSKFSRPKPKCDFQQVVKNYDKLYQTMSNSEVFDNVGFSLNTNSSEVGTSVGIMNLINVKVATKIDTATLMRNEGKGFKPAENLISGAVKTPATVIESETKGAVAEGRESNRLMVGTIMSNAFKSGPIQIVKYTASIFLNTLASKLLKRVFEKGLGAFDFSDLEKTKAISGPDSVVTAGKNDARNANIDLRTPNLQKTGEYDVLPELAACPGASRGTWNCTLDLPLVTAIQTRGDQGGITVAEALKGDLLHGKWQLIPSDTLHAKENQDPDCYNKNYCASNLQKLRIQRILPVGFEFAANSEENKRRCTSQEGCVTLDEVVKGFSNSTSPWYHLIDGNWVITIPPQQCVLQGFGDSLLSDRLDQRREECRDIQTCLSRNNKGECEGGYGYCVAERTAYRFSADECPAEQASCRSYTGRDDASASYLRNTIDYGICGTDNVGCLWYATERSTTGTWLGDVAKGARMYFDKTLESCAAGNDGCTKLLQMEVGKSSLNLIANSSFEKPGTVQPPVLDAWLGNMAITAQAVDMPAYDGIAYASLDGKKTYAQKLPVYGGRSYTVSFYARTSSAGAGNATAQVVQYNDANFSVKSTLGSEFSGAGCVKDATGIKASTSSLLKEWTRFECTFVSVLTAKAAEVMITGTGSLVDAVQLEEGEYATDFVKGVNTALTAAYIKIPPEEIGCTGSDQDPTLCKSFAPICRQSESGCQGYKDINGKGNEIPAIVSANDLCPAECVGYAEYRKSPTSFDLVKDTDPRFSDDADTGVNYFIPSTAASCKSTDVGCEEFTSVEGTTSGGESKEYFRYVRACEKPDANTQTYFTWEGSDTAGYQLRTWSLKKGDKKVDNNDQVAGGPATLLRRDPDQLAVKEEKWCNEANWKTGLDADCRQFYDADGNVFYRFYSQTIVSAEACASYRLNNTNRMDCEKTGGTMDQVATAGECVYQVYMPESRTCTPAVVGCRAFLGVGSGARTPVGSENFQSGKGKFTVGEKSNESLLVGDFSLRVASVAGKNQIQSAWEVPTLDTELYQLSFWAKAPGVKNGRADLTLSTTSVKGGAGNVVGTVSVGSDWQRYSVGPFRGFSAEASTALWWTVGSSGVLYLDEVSVIKVEDISYVRKGTWVTPASCDQSREGIQQPQAMLGCSAYRDRMKRVLNVRQFTRLCRTTAIGCSAFVDTRNATNRGAEQVSENTFVKEDKPDLGFGKASITRPADRFIYIIDDGTTRCQADNASCRAFGKPNYTAD